MAFYKITMILEVAEGHPRKWVGDAIECNLNEGEDIIEIDCEELVDYTPESV